MPDAYLSGAGAAAYGLLVFALLPQAVIALNDDFAYLRSVVETLQRGRPWTDDWLEPWGAGLSVLAALLFKCTGSFYFAVYGLLSLLAAASFGMICLLLASRGVGRWQAAGLALLALTIPTLLWKQVQFTGMALYMPCLFAALWAAERRNWALFSAVWILALSTRQSALAWAALPMVAAVLDVWHTPGAPRRAWLKPALGVVGGVILFLVMDSLMNETLARRVITRQAWAHWNPGQAGRALLAGGAVAALLAGAGGWLLPDGGGRAVERRTRLRWVLPLAVGAALLASGAREHVACEFPTYDSVPGALYLQVAVVFGVSGLLLGGFSVRPLPLAGALASLVLLTLRPMIWDYYLVEIGVWGFFAVGPAERGRAPAAAPAGGRMLPRVLLGALALFHAFALLQTKGVLDRTRAMFDLASRALEEERVPPVKASFLPFGLMAWYFYPYYSRHEGADSANLADFGRYLEQDTVLSAWRFSRPLRRLPGHDGGLPEERSAEIIRGKFNYCWLYGVEVVLLHAPPDQARPGKSPYPAGYRLPVFPRDDAGWRKLIRGDD